jgi:hypothetical protein
MAYAINSPIGIWPFTKKEASGIDPSRIHSIGDIHAQLKPIYEQIKKADVTAQNRDSALALISTISDAWQKAIDSKDQVALERLATQLLSVKSNLPSMEQAAYEMSVKGILAGTLEKSWGDIEQIALTTRKAAISAGSAMTKMMPLIVIGGVGIVMFVGYLFMKQKLGVK